MNFCTKIFLVTAWGFGMLALPATAAKKCGTVEHVFDNGTFKGVYIAIKDICFDGSSLTKPVALSDISGSILDPNRKSRRVEALKDSKGELVGFVFHYIWGHAQADAYRFSPKRIRNGKITVMTNHFDAPLARWADWQNLSKQGGNFFRFSEN